MKRNAWIILGLVAAFFLGFFLRPVFSEKPAEPMVDKQSAHKMEVNKNDHMKLGAFSMSLSVKDLKVSKEFYEKLGFTAFGGGMEQNYLIMKNENALIGLFQGMFQGNILTFNPGWDENAQNIDTFDDVRAIQRQLKSTGIPLSAEADEATSGPASLMLTDPDGNVILIDQHR